MSDKEYILGDGASILIPRGWKVISHATYIDAWSSQDLFHSDQVIIENSAQDGLLCEKDEKSATFTSFTSGDSPVLFRIVVPSALIDPDEELTPELSNLLRQDPDDSGRLLLSSGTTLVRLSEPLLGVSGDPVVFWYTPEQFADLFESDYMRLKKTAAKSAELTYDLSERTVRSLPGDESSDTHVLEQKEKADEYYEDLAAQLQEISIAEAEAENKQADKRSKDREKARALDKKNIARREAEHEKEMLDANSSERFSITSADFTRIEHEFYIARENFRSFDDEVPEQVAQQYKEASDEYYSTMRQISEGTLFVDSSDNSEKTIVSVDSFTRLEQEYYDARQSFRSFDGEVPEQIAQQYKEVATRYYSLIEQASEGSVVFVESSYISKSSTSSAEQSSYSPDEFKRIHQEYLAARENLWDYDGEDSASAERAYKEAADRYYVVKRQIEEERVAIESSYGYESLPTVNPSPTSSFEELTKIENDYISARQALWEHEGDVPISVVQNYKDCSEKFYTVRDSVTRPEGSLSDGEFRTVTKSEYGRIEQDFRDAAYKLYNSNGEITESLSQEFKAASERYDALNKQIDEGKAAIVDFSYSSVNSITSEELRRLEEEYYAARKNLWKHDSAMHAQSAQDYNAATEYYYTVKQQIDRGQISVTDSVSHSEGSLSDGEFRTVTKSEYRRIEQDFRDAAYKLYNSNGEITESLSQEFKAASERYDALNKQIDEGRAAVESLYISQEPAPASTRSSITSDEFNRIEQEYFTARERFRAYESDVPKQVARDYVESNELYYTTKGQIRTGELELVVSSRHDIGIAPIFLRDHPQTLKPGQSKYERDKSLDRITAQNTQTGFMPTPKTVSGLKNPPKNPVDDNPLVFSKERFRAIRRFGSSVAHRSLQITHVVASQVGQVAASEESGTASLLLKTKRDISVAVHTMSVLSKGSGKKKAVKALKEFIASEKGISVKDVTDADLKEFGKINLKNIEEKLKETITFGELNKLRAKYGKAADYSVGEAIGTLNGKIRKRPVIINGKIDVRHVEGKIGALRVKASNLKEEIKALEAKASALTEAERRLYLDLLEKKKKVQAELNNAVGAANFRVKREEVYRQINAMSQKKLKKELDKLEKQLKKGLKLNKNQSLQLSLMRQRMALINAHNAMRGRGLLRRSGVVAGAAGRGVGKFLRNSQDDTFMSMLSITRNVQVSYRFVTNRYVRGAVKWGVKTATLPFRLAGRGIKAIDKKTGVSATVKKQASKAAHNVSSRIIHSKPANTLNKATSSTGKAKKRKVTKIKTAKKKVEDKAKKEVLVKVTRPVSAATLKAAEHVAYFAHGVIFRVAVWVGHAVNTVSFLLPIILAICLAVVPIIMLILPLSSSLFMADSNDTGKLDLSPYIKVLNKEQNALNDELRSYTGNLEKNGGKYKEVHVSYLGGGTNNNIKEILSMTAVYFNQDFSNKSAVDDYMINLFQASNYLDVEEHNYKCSGCETREYSCEEDHSGEENVGSSKGCTKSDPYSCTESGHGIYNENGCTSDGCPGKHIDYSCPGHTEKICNGHTDAYVDVVCLSFDKLFSADPNTSAGVDFGDYEQGELIGTFKITYYCAEKYPHICNAGPPYKTASGTTVTAGRTIAVDPKVIPLGTRVVINGHLYVAEDTGGAIGGNRIDVAVKTHAEALRLGTDTFKVYAATSTKEESPEQFVDRYPIDYLSFAQAFCSNDFSVVQALKAFGVAKEPQVEWKTGRVNADTQDSFNLRLKKFDEDHNDEPFTNAELNAMMYVSMSRDDLKNLCKKRELDHDDSSKYYIITEVLLPYDKEHPDVYVNAEFEDSSDPGASDDEYYFEGWTADNKEIAKHIFSLMTSEIYDGLDLITSGSAGNSVSLEGVTIKGSKIEVVYYSQHDSRWANKPIISDYPRYTISSSGCGFASMAIVVSSLTDNTIDPAGMAEKYGRTYYKPGTGSYWSIVNGISGDYGLSCTQVAANNLQSIINALNKGKLVVALVGSGGTGYTGNGYYTGAGHFLVICGVTDDGKFLMADPNEPTISTSGEGVKIQHFLNSGIKSWWIVGE